jgi:hypothetical protein
MRGEAVRPEGINQSISFNHLLEVKTFRALSKANTSEKWLKVVDRLKCKQPPTVHQRHRQEPSSATATCPLDLSGVPATAAVGEQEDFSEFGG